MLATSSLPPSTFFFSSYLLLLISCRLFQSFPSIMLILAYLTCPFISLVGWLVCWTHARMAYSYSTSCHVASQYTALLCTTPLHNPITTTLFFVHTALLVTETRAIMLYDSLPSWLSPPFVHPSLSHLHIPYTTPASLVRERHFITLCSRTTNSLLTPPLPFPLHPLLYI